MNQHTPFYEIALPKRKETAFILVEINSEIDTCQCQHFITARKLCAIEAIDQCPFCGTWICHRHFDFKKFILIDADTSAPARVNPCDSCSTLPDEDLIKLRELRMETNR